ncbi:MAG: thiamine phosphate synthase [Clostridiales bacterium]|jgi:thiamine-phosphate pyrophosphorylase|nr:thiamine phosphate synthase [Clostridiales bacterium]
MPDKKAIDLTLYLVAGSDGMDESVFLAKIEDALRGGVTLLQLREKEKEGGALYEIAVKVKAVADRYGVPLIVDDRADIALAVGADGVHVGRSDIPVHIARGLMGADKIVGATAKTVGQALQAQAEGADYVGVGAIYPTTTKVKTMLTPVSALKAIADAVRIPAAAIGGLNEDNIDVLKGSGFSGIAVVSALMKSGDAYKAARGLRKAVEMLRGKG